MQVERIALDNIDTPPRLRAVDTDRVQRLAESIDALGLQTPLTVWAKPDDAFQLVAGAHRLEAARTLGWEWIEVFFTDADEIDRQLWEIDENLMRSELTATQQAEHLAKRKELWAARNSGATCTENRDRGRPPEFASETAAATGVDKSTVNRAVSRAEKVCDEARDILRGTAADTGTVLDRLKKLPPGEQVMAAHQEIDRRATKAVADPDAIALERQVAALMTAWNRAGPDARQEFLGRIDSPLMDRNWSA